MESLQCIIRVIKPFFTGLLVRSVGQTQIEAWKARRGAAVSVQFLGQVASTNDEVRVRAADHCLAVVRSPHLSCFVVSRMAGLEGAFGYPLEAHQTEMAQGFGPLEAGTAGTGCAALPLASVGGRVHAPRMAGECVV